MYMSALSGFARWSGCMRGPKAPFARPGRNAWWPRAARSEVLWAVGRCRQAAAKPAAPVSAGRKGSGCATSAGLFASRTGEALRSPRNPRGVPSERCRPVGVAGQAGAASPRRGGSQDGKERRESERERERDSSCRSTEAARREPKERGEGGARFPSRCSQTPSLEDPDGKLPHPVGAREKGP